MGNLMEKSRCALVVPAALDSLPRNGSPRKELMFLSLGAARANSTKQ